MGSPEESRTRFQTAVKGLVAIYGPDRVACGLGALLGAATGPDRKTISNWAEGKTVADYHIATVLIAWHEREKDL